MTLNFKFKNFFFETANLMQFLFRFLSFLGFFSEPRPSIQRRNSFR